MRASLLSLLVLVAFPTMAPAADSFDSCAHEITTLPAILTSQGVWCLKKDLSTAITSGNAITIATNNITLDCNHFKLGGLAAGDGTSTFGVWAEDRMNPVVRNCNIRGFLRGIALNDPAGSLIEDNVFDGNTDSGIYVYGIYTKSTVIRRNRVLDTGGSTVEGTPIGILAWNDLRIEDNVISGVFGDGVGDDDSQGIRTVSGSGTIARNQVEGLTPNGAGVALGIVNASSGRLLVDDNFVDGDSLPDSVGISCFSDLGLARNNVLMGIATGVTGCAMLGNYSDPD